MRNTWTIAVLCCTVLCAIAGESFAQTTQPCGGGGNVHDNSVTPNLQNIGLFGSQTGGTAQINESQAADSFVVGADSTVSRVSWIGAFVNPRNPVSGASQFVIRFFEDSGIDVPQVDPISSQQVSAGVQDIPDLPQLGGTDALCFTADLPTSLTALAGTKYWISIVDDDPTDLWFWLGATDPVLLSVEDMTAVRFRDADPWFGPFGNSIFDFRLSEQGFLLIPEKVTVHFHGTSVPDGPFDRLDAAAFLQLAGGQQREDFVVDTAVVGVEVKVALADQQIADEHLALVIKGKDDKKWEFNAPKGEPLSPITSLKFDWKNEHYDSHEAVLPDNVPRVKSKFIGTDASDITVDFKGVGSGVLAVVGPDGSCAIEVAADGTVSAGAQAADCQIGRVKGGRDGPKVSLMLEFRLTPLVEITLFPEAGGMQSIPVVEGVNFFPQTAKLRLKVESSALSAGLTSESEPKVEVEITLGSTAAAQASGSFVVREEDFDEITFKDFRMKRR